MYFYLIIGVNVTAFEVYIPGLQKPVCFDLPLIPSKRYVLIDIKTNNFGKLKKKHIQNCLARIYF